MLFHDAGKVFFAALIISIVITPLTTHLAQWLGAVDHPDGDRKHHGSSVSRLGGIGIILAFIFPPLFLLPLNRELVGIVAGAGVIAVTGLLDDLIGLRALVKLAGQAIAASCFVFIGGNSLTSFGNLFGLGTIETGMMAPWITIFCIVGVINAMNLSDGLDGLASGFTVIACFFLSILAFDQRDWSSLILLLALMGGSLGFLRYNTHPARLFMGDIGSMMLGYGLATIAVLMARSTPESLHPITPMTIAIVLAIPILDTLVVMFRRMLNGRGPFAPDRTHLHHRLLTLGLPHDQTVMLLYTSAALFGCLALAVRGEPDWLQFTISLVVAMAMFSSMAAFERKQPRIYGLKETRFMQTVSVYAIKHTGWLQRNSRSCALTTLLLIGAATVGATPPNIAGTTMLYAVLVSSVLLYPWHPDREHAAVQKGVVYLMMAVLFLSFQLHATEWLKMYLAILSLAALAIVLVRAVSWDSETRGSSSFQVLILLNMAIIPLVIIPMHGSDIMEHVVSACLEAIPVAWLLNGYSVHIYQRNRRVTMVLVMLIAIVLFKAEIQKGMLMQLLQ